MTHCIKYIEASKPNAYILENVEGLASRHPKTSSRILNASKMIGNGMYDVDAKVLNSKDHGTPHNRGRLYIVGRSHHGKQLERLSWPEPIPAIPMKHFLDEPDLSCNLKSARPGKSAKHAISQVLASYKAMIAASVHPVKSDCVCDIESSKINWKLDCSACLGRM